MYGHVIPTHCPSAELGPLAVDSVHPTTRSTIAFVTEMAEEDYVLWCICENERNTFKVSISPTKDVYDLKTLIVETYLKGKYSEIDLKLTKVRHIMSFMRTS